MFGRFALLLSLLVLSPGVYAQPQITTQFPIKSDDGDTIPNHALSAEQMAQVAGLPGLVVVGNPKGDVTLYQFYDLNCPYCRVAAKDVDALMRADKALRLVLVPYPVLSAQSIEGARVELAVRAIAQPRTFLDFHRKIYAGRGIIDGARALAVTQELRLDQKKIIEVANTQGVTDTMKAHAQLGTALKLMATPAYVIQGVAILGHPGLEPLRKVIRSVRACKAVVC